VSFISCSYFKRRSFIEKQTALSLHTAEVKRYYGERSFIFFSQNQCKCTVTSREREVA